MQTKVTQLLDDSNITYKSLPMETPAFTCEEAAAGRGVPLEEMVKCILVKDKKNNFYLACLLAPDKLDTKKLRSFLDCSRLSFSSKEEISDILGYVMGAIPPLLLKTQLTIIFDEKILQKEKCNISAGDPNLGIELATNDLSELAKPKFADISTSE